MNNYDRGLIVWLLLTAILFAIFVLLIAALSYLVQARGWWNAWILALLLIAAAAIAKWISE